MASKAFTIPQSLQFSIYCIQLLQEVATGQLDVNELMPLDDEAERAIATLRKLKRQAKDTEQPIAKKPKIFAPTRIKISEG